MRICLLTLNVGEAYTKTVKYGQKSKALYASKHNYTYICENTILDPTRKPEWFKVLLILKHLSNFDYVLWVDADTFIMNSDIKIEHLIESVLGSNNEIAYVIAHRWVNNGVILVKNTCFIHSYFKRVYAQKDQICNEQGAMDYLYQINWKNCKEKVKLVHPQNILQSFWDTYRPGDFILHFPGCHEPQRPINSLKRMMNMYCPIRMDEDTDYTYNTRMLWLHISHIRTRHIKEYIPLMKHDDDSTLLQDILLLID